ncbi:hypothetical protein GOV03_04000 [Candidatus Woesearchaeota archaeon]|nr:hypothetical protein [Candidatus Woesearchaeota archaeon]
MLGIERELIERVDKHTSKFSKVLKSCLKVKNEEILIISDYGMGENRLAAMMGYGYHKAAMDKGFKSRIIFQNIKKGFMHADENIVKALNFLEEDSVVVLCLSNKLGRLGLLGKSFRNLCNDKKYRFISASGLGGVNSSRFDLFMESINVNYNRMKKNGLKLKAKLDKAKIIRVKTKKGTDVTFDVEGKEAIANVGDYKEAGKGGNVPAGEVYIPPKGLTGVNGTVVIDGSMRCDEGTMLLEEPLTLEIKEGKIINMEGSGKELLEKTLVRRENRAKYPERVRMIGELGIGINPRAVLVGSSILDEKVLGTAHIAIGSNYWFGGDIRTVLHLDQVFLNPRILVDGNFLKV